MIAALPAAVIIGGAVVVAVTGRLLCHAIERVVARLVRAQRVEPMPRQNTWQRDEVEA